MQQQESFSIWFGLDVSKESFTAAKWMRDARKATFPSATDFGINAGGVAEFMKWARAEAGGEAFGIAMEATGCYSRNLVRLVRSACPGQHISVCNPCRIHWYAKSFSEEKNDKADAAVIARFACERSPMAFPQPPAEVDRLRELIRERHRLDVAAQSLRNSLETLEDEQARKLHQAIIDKFDAAIETLFGEIKLLAKSLPDVKREIDLLTTIPGIGFVSAACIYGELGPLGQYTKKEVSSLSGLSPCNRTSGTSVDSHGMRRHGSKLLRSTLYMASMQAVIRIPALAAFKARLLARPNSSRMSVRCACMRKLFLIAYGVVKGGKGYQADYESSRAQQETA